MEDNTRRLRGPIAMIRIFVTYIVKMGFQLDLISGVDQVGECKLFLITS